MLQGCQVNDSGSRTTHAQSDAAGEIRYPWTLGRVVRLTNELPTRRVGVPVKEGLLVDTAIRRLPKLFPPGPGRSLYVLLEPEIGAGRPDILALHVSSNGLAAHLSHRPRIPHSTAAKALHTASEDESFGVNREYGRRLRRSMVDSGWTPKEISDAARLVRDSLAIEAKLRDWRRAVRQAAKFSPLVARSALLMPQGLPVDAELSLDFYRLGLLEAGPRSSVRWSHPSPRQDLAPFARLWLLELLARGLADGTAQRLS